MKTRLVVAGNGGRTREFPVEQPAEIGRAMHGGDVVLRRQGEEVALGVRDAMVSRRHAQLYFESGRLMIRDIGSTNGTIVNNRLLPRWRQKIGSDPVEIVADSIVWIGNTELEIKVEASPQRESLPRMAQELELQASLTTAQADAKRLVNVRNFILDINNNYCNARTPAKELLSRLNALRGSLGKTELEAQVGDLCRRTAAQLFENEFLGEEHIQRLRAFCAGLIDSLALMS